MNQGLICGEFGLQDGDAAGGETHKVKPSESSLVYLSSKGIKASRVTSRALL